MLESNATLQMDHTWIKGKKNTKLPSPFDPKNLAWSELEEMTQAALCQDARQAGKGLRSWLYSYLWPRVTPSLPRVPASSSVKQGLGSRLTQAH